MLPLLLGGAALGLGKHLLVDKPQADAQRKLAAATATYSPWTGMTPTMPQEANALGSVMQGGLAAAQLGQGMQTAKLNENLVNSQINANNASAVSSGGKAMAMTPPAGQGGGWRSWFGV